MATVPGTESTPADSDGSATLPAMPRKGWQDGIGPAYIGLFLLIVFFDRLAPATVAVGGLGPTLVGVLAGGLLAFAMLYYAPAMGGLRTRGDAVAVASRTFGTAGARWLPGVLLGLVQVAWFAVAIFYAADLSLKALEMGGLIGPQALDAPRPEAAPALGGPVFLFTISVWMLAASLLGPLLVKVVAAILYAYAVFPALALGGLMIWALGGLDQVPQPAGTGGAAGPAFWMAVQLVFGYTATAGLMAADWGAASRSARDVRIGGLVGVGLAPAIIASVALVTTLGALGRTAGPDVPALVPDELIYHRAVFENGIGGLAGCALMMVFCLALLGPACYAPAVYSRRFAAVAPRIPAWAWGLLGAVAAWPLAATGLAGRLETVFGLIGAVLAPVVGAMAADAVRDRDRQVVPRPGLDPAGLAAWLVGVLVGWLPYAGPRLGVPVLERVQPAAVLAFAAAFLTRLVLGRLIREPVMVRTGPDLDAPASPA